MNAIATLLTTILGLWGTFRLFFPYSTTALNITQIMMLKRNTSKQLEEGRKVGISYINEWIMRDVLKTITNEKNKNIEVGNWIIVIHQLEIPTKWLLIQEKNPTIGIVSLPESFNSPFTTSVIFLKDFRILGSSNANNSHLNMDDVLSVFEEYMLCDGSIDLRTTLHIIYYILVERKCYVLLSLLGNNIWIISGYLIIILGFFFSKILEF